MEIGKPASILADVDQVSDVTPDHISLNNDATFRHEGNLTNHRCLSFHHSTGKKTLKELVDKNGRLVH
ncbi:hypothetical protein OCU04_007922 [Sclerotinia nivalis]|uniref:Uncharacterized protein n=1 Tax=Sclerotinia nivalis TaxID=352851 RepID=A0A9X0AJT2_9HELO|nr:hypothetical protein OCU04_007922 [Sclerotinia nivalis]